MGRHSIEVDGLHHNGQPIPVASRVANVVASGGISGIDRATGQVAARGEDQVRLVFANVLAVLETADARLDDVVKLTFYVSDRTLRDTINAEWLVAFPDLASRPARHTLTQELPPGLFVQCELLAVVASS